MGFNLDFEDTFTGGQIEDGFYEVIINRCNEDSTPNGAEYTEFDLIIRNDVDQPSRNMHIFHKVWKRKADNKYNMKQFNTIGKACQLENGKTYNSFEELLQDFNNNVALVRVQNEENEYNGKTYNNLNVKSWESSNFPKSQHQFKKKEDNSESQTLDISDDDLPF